MTQSTRFRLHGWGAVMLLPLFVVVLAVTWLGLAAGADLATLSPQAPRFQIADGFQRGLTGITDRYDHGRVPAAGPAPETARPYAAADGCQQLLANPALDVVNNAIPSWSIFAPRVYYTTDTYVSPNSAVVLPEGDDGDPSPTQDAFGQRFTMPPDLTSVTVEFQTRTGNANGTDKALGNLWIVDAGGDLDQFVGGWEVADSANAWAAREVLVQDSGDLAEMAGRQMAILFFTDANGQAPGEIVYFDDITLTACTGAENTATATPTTGPSQTPTATPTTGPSQTPTATATTGPSQTPTATATGQPASGDKLYLPVIRNPQPPSQPTPTPTASPVEPTPEAGDWTLETVPNQTKQGDWTSIALDTSGDPHVSFADITLKRVMYTHRTSTGWQTQDIDQLAVWPTDLTAPSAVALGPNNRPQIAYKYNNPVVLLRYAEWNGVNWNVVQFAGPRATWLALALKQDGEPCISYYEADAGPGANMAKIALLCRAAGDWPAKPETAVNILGGIHDMANAIHALAIDSMNQRHLSYVQAGHLFYSGEITGGTWKSSLVDGDGRVGFTSSLALDSQDRAHISYYDVSNGDLKYARWDGSQWRVETVDSGGDVGKYTSIAVDGSGRAHISYYDITNQDLKYARWDGSQWRIETVDSAGEVGEYTSLALDTAGRAFISYYDRTNGDLKVASNAD